MGESYLLPFMSDYTSRNAFAVTRLEMSNIRNQSGPDDGELVAD